MARTNTKISRQRRSIMSKKAIIIALAVLLTSGSAALAQEKEELKFSQEQYDMLKRCSEINDMTEWNEWRKNNPDEDVLLEEAQLSRCLIKGAWLCKGFVERASGEFTTLFGEVYLDGAKLNEANLEDAYLQNAHLKGTDLQYANLQGAKIDWASLQGADLQYANLQGADFFQANLQGAEFFKANLLGAGFSHANLQGAHFSAVIVDGSTLILYCKVDTKTDFRSVGLGNICIDSKTKQLLEYNNRRLNWEEWYKDHSLMRWPVRFFWWISDYGSSTKQILFTFAVSSLLFAAVYCYSGKHGSVFVIGLNERKGKSSYAQSKLRVFFKALCFSVATMTTFGFGKIYANPESIKGQWLVVVQLLWGYIVMGALITRLAILFTASGPA